MSCRRICRELLWLSRFGELGPSSQPHLDHLVGCRSCRDEVGFDREMVRQLRVALAERIDGLQPSSSAWETILKRAQAPEPSGFAAWWQRSIGLVGRLRTATAMAGTGLALVLALQMEVMPLPATSPSEGAESSASVLATGAFDGTRVPASERSVSAIPQVRTGKPHPESVMALPLARPDVPDMQVVLSPPGELNTLELTFRTVSTPPKTGTTDEPAEPEAEIEPAPSPAELGIPS
jgi:hypothetical protein